MGLTTALYSGLTGLTVNSIGINVSGNNIANVNTTAYKSSKALFETQISQNLRSATGPSADLGGTNPSQLGLGVRLGSIARNFTNGSITPTGVNTDLAIEGSGMFVLRKGGQELFTRAGTFKLDSEYNLVSPDGSYVQGLSVDDDFNLIQGAMGNLSIPLGSTLAQATGIVHMAGNLNAGGDTATIGSLITSSALTDASTAAAATGATLLTDLQDTGVNLFVNNDVITVSGATKGGASLPDFTFQVGATNTTGSDAHGTTLADLLTFFDHAFGIDTIADPAAGVTVNVGGQITIQGNTGGVNDIVLNSGHIVLNKGGLTPSTPFTMTKAQSADGESVRTTFVVFDSLGTPLTIDLSVVLQDKTNAGTTWRFYAQSSDDTDLDRVLGTGVLSFDTEGALISVNGDSFTIDRTNTGAGTPQSITLDFSSPLNTLSALRDTTSQIAATNQDGSPIGRLADFAIGEDGIITGVYTNSLLRTLGRVMLADFSNPAGLKEVGGNLFQLTINSGLPQFVAPGAGGSGRIVGGALELSNVDLSQEFISLITYSTGFSASSRVLTTSDRLIQELLNSVR